ncbi:MAG: hypothetical protein J7L43_01095 [Candidatus Aenigmarchaeota archaeon]|nr:hypothetical protein [Candidatus Aenigmarchaeota archaeon]
MIEEILGRIEEKISGKQLTEDNISKAVDTATDEVVTEFLSDYIPGFDLDGEDLEEWDEDWVRFIRELREYKEKKLNKR